MIYNKIKYKKQNTVQNLQLKQKYFLKFKLSKKKLQVIKER